LKKRRKSGRVQNVLNRFPNALKVQISLTEAGCHATRLPKPCNTSTLFTLPKLKKLANFNFSAFKNTPMNPLNRIAEPLVLVLLLFQTGIAQFSLRLYENGKLGYKTAEGMVHVAAKLAAK
jgi:hypothetical protein